MKTSIFLTRALSALEKGTIYDSPGKMPSFDANVWPAGARNDCSGFVDWCLRFSPNRKVDHPLYKKTNGGWFETTTIFADGLSAVGFFSKLNSVVPGALLVYPDYSGADRKHHDGHVGIVLKTDGPAISQVTEVIHCSLTSWKKFGDGIRVTDASAWHKHKESIAVWFDSLEKD